MWDKVLEYAMSNGIWALLFCSLFIFQLKDSKLREVKYQDTIEKLSDGLNYIKNIDEAIGEIKIDIRHTMDKKYHLKEVKFKNEI